MRSNVIIFLCRFTDVVVLIYPLCHLLVFNLSTKLFLIRYFIYLFFIFGGGSGGRDVKTLPLNEVEVHRPTLSRCKTARSVTADKMKGNKATPIRYLIEVVGMSTGSIRGWKLNSKQQTARTREIGGGSRVLCLRSGCGEEQEIGRYRSVVSSNPARRRDSSSL